MIRVRPEKLPNGVQTNGAMLEPAELALRLSSPQTREEQAAPIDSDAKLLNSADTLRRRLKLLGLTPPTVLLNDAARCDEWRESSRT